MKIQFLKRIFILSLYPVVICWSQDSGRQHRHIPLPPSGRNILPHVKNGIAIENDISTEEEKFSCNITLRNFKKGEIEHPLKEKFVKTIKQKIQKLSKTKQIKEIQFVGWADGIPNHGINVKKFKIKIDCLQLVHSDTIFDPELAVLRACEMAQLLSKKIYNIPVKFDKLIDIHNIIGVDVPDNVDTGGNYRKVIAKIKY